MIIYIALSRVIRSIRPAGVVVTRAFAPPGFAPRFLPIEYGYRRSSSERAKPNRRLTKDTKLLHTFHIRWEFGGWQVDTF